MNASELKKLLTKHGATFETHRGGSGHQTARLNGKKATIPTHGNRKELGPGLVHSILKQLGLK